MAGRTRAERTGETESLTLAFRSGLALATARGDAVDPGWIRVAGVVAVTAAGGRGGAHLAAADQGCGYW